MPFITIADLRGGRNGRDNILDPTFPDNQAAECKNVDFDKHAPLSRKRGGVATHSTSGGTAFSGGMLSMIRHVPAGDETAAELWGIDKNALFKRLAGGSNYANVTPDDAMTGTVDPGVVGVTFNGKLFLFYDSAVDRSHVWDGTYLRRASLSGTTAAPTVANTGAGAYAATARYYRIRWLEMNGTLVVRRSEPSATSLSFTPSGAGTAARVTRAAAPSERETHWEVEGSTDGVIFYRIAGPGATGAAIAIATSTYDDTALTSSYSGEPLSDPLGYHQGLPSFKYAITDGNRLILAGFWETGNKGSRIYYTPVLGSQNTGDDERLTFLDNRKPYTDINEKDGGEITALGGPIGGGLIFAFKYRQVWVGTPTPNVDSPYRWQNVSRVVGAVSHKAVFLGEDSAGKTCVYFWSHKGPHRIGPNGLEYLGRDIEDIIFGFGSSSFGTGFNFSAAVPAHGVYHVDKSRVEFYISIGSEGAPTIKVALYVKEAVRVDRYGVRGGWVYHTVVPETRTMCSCMFASTVGASMSKNLKPYVGLENSSVGKTDDDTSADDMGTDFVGSVLTKSIVPTNRAGKQFGVGETILICQPLPNKTIEHRIIYDFGRSSQPATVALTATAEETTADHIIRKVDGGGHSDMGVVQIQLGDAAAAEGQWHLDALLIPVEEERDK